MSATGRGAERRKDDRYFTPSWLTRAVLPELRSRLILHSGAAPCVLEPACGELAIVNVVTQEWQDAIVDYSDICAPYGIDFLTAEPEPIYDLVISNPPYLLAMEFVQRAMRWRKALNSVVAMLLRVPWLASRGRAKWMRQNTPTVAISPRRPSFTEDGKTDATDYAWMIWDGRRPTVLILETEDHSDEKIIKLPSKEVDTKLALG